MALSEFKKPSGLQRTERLRTSLQVVQSKAPAMYPPTDKFFRQDLSTLPFFKFSDVDAVTILGHSFAPELERLKHAEPTVETGSRKPSGNLGPDNLMPSQFLFCEDFPEVDRTVVAVLTLKWLLSNDYGTFTAYQDFDMRLSLVSFKALREMFLASFQSGEEVYALIVAIVINDLGKDKALWEEVQPLLQTARLQPNHDEILYLATRLGLVPLISDFLPTSSCYTSIVRGLLLGSSLNLAQLVQAENVPASLLAIRSLNSDRHALTLKFFEILLDVGGAQGHIEARSCTTLTEPLYQAYCGIRKAMFGLAEGSLSSREAYDEVLYQRAAVLSQSGFRSLRVEKQNDRALLRLLCMARVASPEEGYILDDAFSSLGQPAFAALVEGLSVDGIDDGDAIIPYYAPSLFAVLFRNRKQIPSEKFVKAVRALLRFLSRVYRGTAPMKGRLGRVTECDLHFAQATLKSEAFVEDPSVLDRVEIPMTAYGDALDTESIAKGVS